MQEVARQGLADGDVLRTRLSDLPVEPPLRAMIAEKIGRDFGAGGASPSGT